MICCERWWPNYCHVSYGTKSIASYSLPTSLTLFLFSPKKCYSFVVTCRNSWQASRVSFIAKCKSIWEILVSKVYDQHLKFSLWLGNLDKHLVCNIWSSNIITNQMFVEMQKGNTHETSMHVRIENNIRSIVARRYTCDYLWENNASFFFYFTSNENYKPTKRSSRELTHKYKLTKPLSSLFKLTSLQNICILFSLQSLQVAPVCL